MMPKVYYYTDEEVGVPFIGPDGDRKAFCREYNVSWPRFVWYRWNGFETITNPKNADVFVIRQRLRSLTNEQIDGLPYLSGNERRHVFFDLDDHNIRTFPHIQGIFFRAVSSPEIRKANPNTILWPWPIIVSLFQEYITPVSPDGFKYDVVFQGYATRVMRHMIELLEKAPLKTFFNPLAEFWPRIKRRDPQEAAMLTKLYRSSMRGGKLLLCPRHLPCTTRARLWEGMAMGRVSVFLNDHVLLPLADKIDWDKCLVRLPENSADKVDEILVQWLAEHGDDDIVRRGQYAREMWLKWFAPQRWGQTAEMLVRKILGL